MGSTYIDYEGSGFEASDGCIEIWLMLLVQEIDRLEDRPGWLEEVRQEWHLQATAGFGFGVMPQLDRFITEPERNELIRGLCDGALARLEAMGPVLTAAKLNALGTGGEGAWFTDDVPADAFVRTARYFIKLLDGTLGPSETDARFPPQT